MTIDNGSSHVIAEVRIAAVGRTDWGPNLLANALFPNDRLTISVVCDSYEVLVSDDRARDCVLGNIDLCFADKLWTIDDTTLRSCAY